VRKLSDKIGSGEYLANALTEVEYVLAGI
jgi:hypothetical protein